MYTMTVDGRPLFDPRVIGYNLERPTLTQDANKFATLKFTIYPDHPEYSQIQKQRSIITIYQDGALFMKMRPVKTKLAFRGGLEYQCEELAARLNDILQRPAYYSSTPSGYINGVLTDFNARYQGTTPGPAEGYTNIGGLPLQNGSSGVNVRKLQTNLVMLGYSLARYGVDGAFGNETEKAVRQFQRDNILTVNGVFDSNNLSVMVALIEAAQVVTPTDDNSFGIGTVAGIPSDTTEFINNNYVGYWDLLQEKLVKQFGGYLIPRYTNSGILIDYLDEDNLPGATQNIVFGKNLADLFIQTDAANTFSVLIPLGADVRAQNIHSGQAKNTPLTIASVNNNKDYLENEYGLNLYGRREVTYRWDDVKDASTLKILGQTYLNEHSVMLAETISLSAIDLRDAGVSVQALNWMTRVTVIDTHTDLEAVYPLTKKTTPLGKPGDSKIQLGATKESLTDRITGNATIAAHAYSTLNGKVFDIENPEE